ncbi:ATP-dependent DNA helicase [Salmonella enterica subsp. enterica]|uniref:ATP-dependent DNA helicase n=1 Tax=Salmonella enterica I TaxID=59201 RepID=A0A3S4JF03_SALET|nr:ATP-dependent DNA helicase [Salmonella enterica subsp. enterica]
MSAQRKAVNWRKLACIPSRICYYIFLWRYEDRTHLYPIGELLPGIYATVEGEVLNCNITFGGRRMMTCQISDGSGILTMRFFNFNAAMKNSLATGRRVLAYGEAKRGKYGAEMIHPEYRLQGDLSTPELQETLTPSIRPPRA